VGDKVLVKQSKVNKFSTPFRPTPLTVVAVKGTMVTAKSENYVTTRNASHFKKLCTDSPSLSRQTAPDMLGRDRGVAPRPLGSVLTFPPCDRLELDQAAPLRATPVDHNGQPPTLNDQDPVGPQPIEDNVDNEGEEEEEYLTPNEEETPGEVDNEDDETTQQQQSRKRIHLPPLGIASGYEEEFTIPTDFRNVSHSGRVRKKHVPFQSAS
jgi:hypothetical protein